MGRALRLAGWGAAALAILGFAGAFSRVADLASHFRVGYALAMLPALATYLPAWRKRGWRAAVLALILAADTAPVAALYLPRTGRRGEAPRGPELRLLQYNTWTRNQNDQGVLSLIESERPDLVSLQETSSSLRGAVERYLSDNYTFKSAGAELILIRRDGPSPEPRGWETHELPGGGKAIAVRLGTGGREVEVLGLHAMAPVGLGRAALRDAQFDWVARWCRSRGRPVIVLGDLNATPWSSPFARLLREGGLIDSTRGFGVQPTWRTSYGPIGGLLAWPLQIPIDHCLHSPSLITTERRRGPAGGSNHFPIFATVRWAD
jgi:endonuclease/exonuclease/phosphatase (EEP) superfamily protein YafD